MCRRVTDWLDFSFAESGKRVKNVARRNVWLHSDVGTEAAQVFSTRRIPLRGLLPNSEEDL